VTGAFNFPAGWEYNCHDNTLYMATKLLSAQGNLTGYAFYTVDVTTAAATLITSTNVRKLVQKHAASANGSFLARPSFTCAYMQASNDNAYDGWFHELAPDASTFYRMGYEDVVNEQNFGIGSTDVTRTPGKSPPKLIFCSCSMRCNG